MGNQDGTTPGYWPRKAKLSDDMTRINMEAFDKLPRVLRQALANSDHNWSAAQALAELRKPKAKRRAQCASASIFAAEITAMDARKHARDAQEGIVAP
jgi:hypothetical protein